MFLSQIKRTQYTEYNELDSGKPHLGKYGGKSHSGNGSSQPLTTTLSIKVEEKFYILQSIK